MSVSRYAPKPRLQRDLDRLAVGISHLRRVHNLIHRTPEMPGEIRDALAKFKAAHAKMTANIVAEMEKATAETFKVESEGIAAVKLPAAMVASTRAEIRDITAEFSTKTNGEPDSPLSGEASNSAVQSVDSAAVASDTQSAEKKS